ncbi:MAG: response regulator transcription factor [Actinobacteria bacterium]|nr:response regulator transcription factor [Actinomycetota bacterium]
MGGKRVLVIDDEEPQLQIISYALKEAGYDVETGASAGEAKELFDTYHPNLAILDIMLPDGSGLEVCRHYREKSDVPVIFLSAKSEEFDKVLGLELGADDYITKPFSPKELVSRVRAHLRRYENDSPVKSKPIQIGDLKIDTDSRQVFTGGSPVHLTNSEYEILVFLARHPGKAFSRASILNSLWEGGFVGDERTVDVHIHNLREKLEKDPQHPEFILTVRNFGYRLRDAR